MIDSPHQRRSQIMAWLQERKSLAVDELAGLLNVSVMTVHRDLDQLAQSGQIRKVYGGAVLNESVQPTEAACDFCNGRIPARTSFTIRLEDGSQLQACCPHCGILILNDHPNSASALTRDFLYGRMVNVLQASYVVESRIALCCVPSTLCFINETDARDFVSGFGGEVIQFQDLRSYLDDQHHCGHHER